ncbi:MAG: hypothetical protein M1834_002615 [Cirrosporium novae-zelandiae]|nr:MAG: hypothetical protein M1834_002615 [Cirrosporium novae-zelandiae]
MAIRPAIEKVIQDYVTHPNALLTDSMNEMIINPLNDKVVVLNEPSSKSVKNARNRTSSCYDEIRKYLSTLREYGTNKELQDFKIEAGHTWNDVLNEAAWAIKDYNSRAQGWRGIFTRGMRNLGDVTVDGAVDPWMGLLPNNEYTSFVCGGLKLILGAVKAKSDLRETILNELSCVPETLCVTYEFRQLHPKDARLNETATDFYAALVFAIEGSITWLRESAIRPKFKALLQQGQYGKHLRERFAAVQDLSRILKSRVNMIQRGLVTEMSEGVGIIQSALTGPNGMENVLNSFSQDLRLLVQQSQWNQMYRTIIDAQARVIENYRARTPNQVAEAPISQAELMQSIGIDLNEVVVDSQFYQDIAQAIDLPNQRVVQQVLSNPRFRKWFQSSESKALLIHSKICSKVSPFSLLVTSMHLGLSGIDHVIYLQYFCERHRSVGLRGMLRSLIAQLLAARQFGLCSVLTRSDLSSISEQDLQTLCELFGTLVRSLTGTPTTLFCVIDTVNLLEQQTEHQDELRYVSNMLCGLASEEGGANANNNGRAVIKLCMSSPDISTVIRESVSPDDEIFVGVVDASSSSSDYSLESPPPQDQQREIMMQLLRAERINNTILSATTTQRRLEPPPPPPIEHKDGYVEF